MLGARRPAPDLPRRLPQEGTGMEDRLRMEDQSFFFFFDGTQGFLLVKQVHYLLGHTSDPGVGFYKKQKAPQRLINDSFKLWDLSLLSSPLPKEERIRKRKKINCY